MVCDRASTYYKHIYMYVRNSRFFGNAVLRVVNICLVQIYETVGPGVVACMVGWSLNLGCVVTSSLQSCFFAVRCRGFAATMAGCPKGLAGTEWLVAQGARHEMPRARRGTVNPELSSSNLQYLAENTEQVVDEDHAADWQCAYAEHRRSTLQAAAVDPARMVQYVAGRPCVVPG